MQKDNKYSVKYLDSIEKICYYYIIMEYYEKININQIILRQLNKNLKKLNELNFEDNKLCILNLMI